MIARLKAKRQVPAQGGPVPEAAPAAVAEPGAPAPVIPDQRVQGHVRATLDLEEAARAYTEVVQLLGALTRTAQSGADAAAVTAMSTALDSAWGRWDSAHRRLIGAQRGPGAAS